MSVKVTWGNKLPLYQKSNENYNSTKFRWLRYTENLKRGWVLSCESGKIKLKGMEKISGLEKLDTFRKGICEEIIKNPTEENYLFYLNVLELVLEEHFPNIKDFDKWGLEGDEYSPWNNPFSELETIKK